MDSENILVCPYCNTTYKLYYQNHKNIVKNLGTKIDYFCSFDGFSSHSLPHIQDFVFKITITKCPHCEGYTVTANALHNITSSGYFEIDNTNFNTQLMPISNCRQFPDYIPQNIRNDYEEAYAILSLSPKASATLARRCLQGMIRDFWNISKRTLYDEIDALKDIIPADQWNAIDALRKIGNIGAHMEKDVNTIIDIEEGEAEKLLKFIEYLMKQWYIDRHDREQLMADIVGIADTIKS